MTTSHRLRDLRAAAVLVLVLAAVTIPGSAWWSGPVLLTLTPTHGVHLADLGVVAMGLLVAVQAWRAGVLRSVGARVPASRLDVARV